MAKIKHNNFLDTVNEVFTDAKREGVLHLYADEDNFSGRTIGVNNKKLFHFGTTSYLGLEKDSRLKEAAISAIQNYGTQFPLSKTYISNPLYKKLEDKLAEMYNNQVIITKNSTLGHMGVIPSAVKDQDAIILDHQVHWSVQSAAKVLKMRSVPIDMIRHNDLNMLEDKIKSLSNTRKRIWYMADGIYSMYGDFAPIKELECLTQKYPQLHLYIDDVHGMSWIGKNGTGYALSELNEISDNILIFGTLSKTFGASGAVLICSDKNMYQEIKTFGGPLTFSAQLEPASVAAATASAEIHLSPEIYSIQDELKSKIQFFNQLLSETELPLIDQNRSPVFYIGTGMPKTGYNFVGRLMKEGFFVNLGIFPAVPVKNTGVRITISRHNEKPEIQELVNAMIHHYPLALKDTHTTIDRVYHAFKLNYKSKTDKISNSKLNYELKNSISDIDKGIWNRLVGNSGVYDWDGLQFLEHTFSNNIRKEHNWKFIYLIIYDIDKKPVLATYMTLGLWKDDMLATVDASLMIEEERQKNPYHLTSEVLSTGSLFTEGNHLYIDDESSFKKEALNLLMQIMESLEKKFEAKMLVLRDFSEKSDLHNYFQGQGFVRIQMPNSCTVNFNNETSIEEFYSKLSSRNRKHLRKEILINLDVLDIHIFNSLSHTQLEKVQELYNNVHQNNIGLNTFTFPDKLFKNMSDHPNWEFIMVNTKSTPSKLIGVMLCYKNQQHTYVPSFVGMDYEYLKMYHIYRQLLYQTIKRAFEQGFDKVDLGMTASFEKRKLGAIVEEKYAYIQTSDNYTLELMGLIEGR